jgi:hypothetical protein
MIVLLALTRSATELGVEASDLALAAGRLRPFLQEGACGWWRWPSGGADRPGSLERDTWSSWSEGARTANSAPRAVWRGNELWCGPAYARANVSGTSG